MATFNYGITIKHIELNSTMGELDLFNVMLDYIKRQKGLYVIHTYEFDTNNRLHLHGHFMARKGIRYNLFQKKGWHIHVDPLPTTQDVETWTNYIKKDYTSAQAWLNHMRQGEYEFVDI